jgi:hypothetical protein
MTATEFNLFDLPQLDHTVVSLMALIQAWLAVDSKTDSKTCPSLLPAAGDWTMVATHSHIC